MNRELRTLVGRALDFHFAVVGLDHCFDQKEVEAETHLRAALVAAIEPLPNPRNFRRRNADPVVFDAQDGLLVLLAGGDLDSPVLPIFRTRPQARGSYASLRPSPKKFRASSVVNRPIDASAAQ